MSRVDVAIGGGGSEGRLGSDIWPGGLTESDLTVKSVLIVRPGRGGAVERDCLVELALYISFQEGDLELTM
jgi:hypothetical protein